MPISFKWVSRAANCAVNTASRVFNRIKDGVSGTSSVGNTPLKPVTGISVENKTTQPQQVLNSVVT